MNRVFIIGCFVACALSGCLPDPLPVGNIPSLDSKIVISSQMVPDQTLAVLLTKSFGALDANGSSDPQELLNQIAINDAIVILKGPGLIDTLSFIETGVYGSVAIPFAGEQFYTLHVNSPSMGKVTATAQMKAAVRFSSLTATINDNGFDTLAHINYSLQDIPGRNYYMINVQHISAANSPEPQDFLNPNVFIKLQDDENRDSQVITESFNAIFRRDFIPGDTILVQLANVDQGYYDFLELRRESRFDFSDFLGEPINYPTNVIGGLGWFTLHYPDVRVLRVE